MRALRRLLHDTLTASRASRPGGWSPSTPWEPGAYRKAAQSHVAVLAAPSYTSPLTEILCQGLQLFRLRLHGKTVVLKPNLVEYDPGGAINTHPAVIAAAIEAFRRLGARAVLVAEGPGHRRDTEYLLHSSGLYTALQDHQVPYTDLNYDGVRLRTLQSHFSALRQLYFPETVLRADLLVSMPKLKTHHWVGVTLALKNLFGLIPGAIYGWPKNLLHWAGIQESILDINSSLPIPQFAIVDGIVGMEGNGPIQGAPRPCGVLLMGDDLVAVDATATRLMQIEPQKIPYLAQAGRFLGNVAPEQIVHLGEDPARFQQDFQVLPAFQHLKTRTV
jgi:uncharacterized protein (DUF362 family)